MKYWIDEHVSSGNVVTPWFWCISERDIGFMKKSFNPKKFSNGVGKRFVFGLYRRSRDGGLLPRAP
jgi:hypothetical protein